MPVSHHIVHHLTTVSHSFVSQFFLKFIKATLHHTNNSITTRNIIAITQDHHTNITSHRASHYCSITLPCITVLAQIHQSSITSRHGNITSPRMITSVASRIAPSQLFITYEKASCFTIFKRVCQRQHLF
jgi:hypothetical protein